MNRRASLICLSPALTVALIAPGAAAAQYHAGDPINDRFSISLGTFLLGTDTTIRVSGALNGRRIPGTQFNIEQELGFRDTNRFRADAYWRFFKRHKLTAMYFQTSRHQSHAIDEQLQFRDTVFPLSAQLDSEYSTTIFEIAYEYAVWRREKYEIGINVGVHNLSFSLGLAATGAGIGGQTRAQSSTAAADGPLPVVGIHGVWRLRPNFYLNGQGQYFQVSIDPYDGRIHALTLSAVWQALPHLGIGAGYNEFNTRVDVTASRFDGNLRWRYSGARLFVVASF